MSEKSPIPRRTFLKGLGTAMALPLLDAMLPRLGFPGKGLTGTAFSAVTGGAAKTVPNRLAFLYVPNGIHMEAWTPSAAGADFELPPTLEPLKPLKDQLLVLSGLTQDKARPNGDGPGDHARAAAAFLTGVQPLKTHGANIRAGISIDQIAAERTGQWTRLPSLELGCDRGMVSGDCDSGYSCAYSANISWKTESLPMAKEINPRLVFERLFSSGSKDEGEESRVRRERYRRSILDFVLDDAARLKKKLGFTDRRKLDEYLSAVREIEGRIERAERSADEPQAPSQGVGKPAGTPKDYQEHIRLLCDLLVLAFQADITRVSTFMLANEGSNRSYPFVGVPEGHHDLSHHGGKPEKLERIQKINHFHVTQLEYFLKKLKSVKEGDGTLLDNSMVIFGSGISDGNRHNHDELPVLLAGKGGGTIETGRHVRYPRNTPLNNLYLSLLVRMEVQAEQLGDSTGRLPQLLTQPRLF
jgi:hypothetical protein